MPPSDGMIFFSAPDKNVFSPTAKQNVLLFLSLKPHGAVVHVACVCFTFRECESYSTSLASVINRKPRVQSNDVARRQKARERKYKHTLESYALRHDASPFRSVHENKFHLFFFNFFFAADNRILPIAPEKSVVRTLFVVA